MEKKIQIFILGTCYHWTIECSPVLLIYDATCACSVWKYTTSYYILLYVTKDTISYYMLLYVTKDKKVSTCHFMLLKKLIGTKCNFM